MILVTGATGNIGREVVKELLRMGQPVRAAAIDDADAKRVPQEAEVVLFDFTDPGSYTPALEGVQKLFLLRPPQITDMENTLNPFVDQAISMGVRQIIFLSLMGIEDNPRVPHYAAEQHIKNSGATYTFLRPSYFMQNLNTTHRMEIQEKDEIYIPAGDSKISFIDTRDIGAVAARVLTEDGHENQAYSLTGGETLDYYQAAEVFSEVLERKITYRNPSTLGFMWYSWRRGVGLMPVFVMAMLYNATRKGSADKVTDDVSKLLERPPTDFRQYVEDYQEMWQR